MSAIDLDAARAWLASADPDPEHALRWWQNDPSGVCVVPAGTLFDAIEIPGVGRASKAIDSAAVTGPVMRHATMDRYYVLVPPGTDFSWSMEGTAVVCIGAPHYLRCPDVCRIEPRGLYWVVQPDGSGALTDPAWLAQTLRLIEAGERV